MKPHFGRRRARIAALGAGAISLAAVLANPVFADDKELLDALLKNGIITNEQYQKLSAKGSSGSASSELLEILAKNGALTKDQHAHLAKMQSEEKHVAAKDKSEEHKDGRVNFSEKGLELESGDGNFKARLGGRLHLDGTFYANDDGTSDVSGVDARRARLEFQGLFYKNWMWKLDYEFGQTSEVKGGFRDAYIRYLAKDTIPGFPASLTIGQFKEHFGLEHQNSSNHMPFVERALVSRVFHDFAEASDGRRLGVSAQVEGHDMWTTAFGVFGKNVSGDSSDGFNDPVALEGRTTFSPIHTHDAALHFAFAGNWIKLDDPDQARFRSRAEGRIGAQQLLDTGEISGAQDVNRWGLETGGIYGPLWLQAEYLRTDVHRKADRTVSFDGWHTDIGWVLTGEPRGYDWHQGVFTNPKPHTNFGNGGWGAWEVAARYSVLDLTSLDIRGGREANFTAGINWFLNPNFALKADWTKVLDINGGEFSGQKPSQFLMRAQAFW